MAENTVDTAKAENNTTETKKGGKEKKLLPYHPNKGDRVLLISPVMQTVLCEFFDEDKEYFIVKNPVIFAAFPERDKDNPNQIRIALQAPCVWNRGIMADVNQDQIAIFPKATYGLMFIDDETTAPMFSTDVKRIYNSVWGKTEEKAPENK